MVTCNEHGSLNSMFVESVVILLSNQTHLEWWVNGDETYYVRINLLLFDTTESNFVEQKLLLYNCTVSFIKN